MVDYNSLNTRQKLNVLGLRIQREYTKRRHGEHVRIATTEEDAAQESGFMALPTTRVAPGKQLYMRMGELKELPSGGFQTVKTAEQIVDPNFSVDLLTALEEEERKLFGDSSIVARAYNDKAGTPTSKSATVPEMLEMPEMPAIDSFDRLADDAERMLGDLRNVPDARDIGRAVVEPAKRREAMSDSDFIKSLLGK